MHAYRRNLARVMPVACRLLRDSERIVQQLTATGSGRFGRPQRLDLRRLRVSRLPSVRCACLLSIGRCARRRCRRAACALGQDASAAASIADGIARARSANGQSVGTRQQRGTTSRTVKGAIRLECPPVLTLDPQASSSPEALQRSSSAPGQSHRASRVRAAVLITRHRWSPLSLSRRPERCRVLGGSCNRSWQRAHRCRQDPR